MVHYTFFTQSSYIWCYTHLCERGSSLNGSTVCHEQDFLSGGIAGKEGARWPYIRGGGMKQKRQVETLESYMGSERYMLAETMAVILTSWWIMWYSLNFEFLHMSQFSWTCQTLSLYFPAWREAFKHQLPTSSQACLAEHLHIRN